MKKLDRFERETWKQFKRWANGPQYDGWINGVTIKLLRREHAWMRRMVKRKKEELIYTNVLERKWYKMACDEILDQLTIRRE